jgi:hypothetical protein
MKLHEIMNENEIKLEWLFTLSKFDDKEGLMFFEPVIETKEDGTEVNNLDPKCFLIDGGKFVYDEAQDNKIIINAIDGVITFTRVDGIQVNIDTKTIKGFPYAHEQFKDVVFGQQKAGISPGLVEVAP